MPTIQNISRDDCKNGCHVAINDRAVLIQIADPASFFPNPKHVFSEIHQFEFLDAEDKDAELYGEEPLFQQHQADAIATILSNALAEDRDVIVHCHAGICRSGSVAEVGVMMGFSQTQRYRQPNIRVKSMLINALGWGYNQ